ncbi:unnamed protein product, partial [Vitis vinifera]
MLIEKESIQLDHEESQLSEMATAALANRASTDRTWNLLRQSFRFFRSFSAAPSASSSSVASFQTLQLPRSQSEERRRTCSRWLSFSQTGDSDITWPRLTGPAFPMRLSRSISTRTAGMGRREDLFTKTVCRLLLPRKQVGYCDYKRL